jgi:uncharacterized damage-inducible protein DinB
MRPLFTLMMCGVLGLTITAVAHAQQPKDAPRTVTQVLDGAAKGMEHEFVPAAEAMPEDKYGFAPTEGEFKNVRTFGQQVKHVAAVNYELAAAILQESQPADINGEAGPASVTSKADILNYLKESFRYAHKAVATINQGNEAETVKSPFGEGKVSRLGLACSISWHGYDHYGQMAVYLRMNGIVPPASR